MTLAEINRVIESKIRVQKEEDKRRAMFDYTLSNLIGRSVARIYNSKATMPELEQAYPHLFGSEELTEEEQAERQKINEELSIARFKAFAQTHNKQFKEVGA